ncbi:MAG: DNA gyrase subunit A [Polyangiaceae bacterium]|nr:DNA gyrase subunit A [Polyangiaceae bacterium]
MAESNIEQRIPVSLQDEMRTSYLDYAMSVIIGRALPDVRDGLKPVHRRILFSMYEQKINATGAYKKCARVVGDVLGKYHPHGDLAVYDALVRMGQPFSLRGMLIDGQGNYGSVDGDSPAAMRYTECRLSRLAGELLADLDKETVDFVPNYDDNEEEPSVLPARWPNLLVNGAEGIAVGMATKIPPHNLGETIAATIALIRNPDATLEELMAHMPGPDFPTGGFIYGKAGIEQAYRTGRGSLAIRAKTIIEPALGGKTEREQIVVTEIPYQVNKARLTKRIAELTRDKEIEGIAEVRDESDREGIRLVIELKKDVFPQVVLNQLFRMTDMQITFGVINLSVVRGRPAVLGLKETLAHFVAHRREVVTRRCRYELRVAEAQRELNLGYGMATTEIDLVVRTIRESPDTDEARARLMKLPLSGLEAYVRRAGRPEAEIAEAALRGQVTLSERQAKAILEMRLSRLTGLEQEKLATEYGELSEEIAKLRAILASEALLLDVIVAELEDVKARYADPRRTEIIAAEAEINLEDLIQVRDMVVTVSHLGYIKRTPAADYAAQRRGGKGRIGHASRDEDYVSRLFVASTHAFVFFFTDKGKVYVKKVYEVPEAARNAKGRAIVNFVGMEPGEKVTAIAIVPELVDGKFVLTLTRNGLIKKTELLAYENFRERGIIGVKIEDGDELLSAEVTDGTREILIATEQGMSIRFAEDQVRPTGRDTMGVKGITLEANDRVAGFLVTEPGRDRVLAMCEKGYGKRTAIDEFRGQNRGGKGIILIDASDRNGPCVGISLVKEDDEVMLVTDRGQTLRTKVSEIRETGRNAQGVKVIRVDDGERLVAVERLAEQEVGGDGEPGADDSVAPPAEATDE